MAAETKQQQIRLQVPWIEFIQRRWQVLWIALVVLVVLLIMVGLVGSYAFNWDWTGFKGNKFWDWLNLLIAPVLLAVLPLIFNGQLDHAHDQVSERPKWTRLRPHGWQVLWMGVVVVILAVIVVGAIGTYAFNWDWTGFRERGSLWDWLSMLAAPVLLGALPLVYSGQHDQAHDKVSEQQYQSDLIASEQSDQVDPQVAEQPQQKEILEVYQNYISELLLAKNLSESQPGSDVRIVARARTLTALQQVGKNNKGVLLLFLHEAGLIYKEAIVDLRGADLKWASLRDAGLNGSNLSETDLSGADLNGSNLSWAKLNQANLSDASLNDSNLSRADLSGATLSWANLSGATLSGSNLSNADLRGAKLRWANLSGADLSSAKLNNADLSGADLSNANLSGVDLGKATYTMEQLNKAKSRDNIIQ